MAMLSKQEYEEGIQRVLEQHPWAKNSIIRPAPGHLHLLDRLLVRVEEILGTAPIKTAHKDFFFVDSGDAFKEIKVYGEFSKASRARTEAINDTLEQYSRGASRHCAVCGEALKESFHSRSLCPAHAEFISVFSDEQPLPEDEENEQDEIDRIFAEKPDSLDVEVYAAFQEQAIAQNGDMEGSDLSSAQDKKPAPTIQIYDPSDLYKLIRASDAYSDKNQKERYGKLIKDLKKSSPLRFLGLLPENWESSLDLLLEHFPNFSEVLSAVRDYCLLSEKGGGIIAIPPILLAGPPGVGKTEMVLSLSEMLGLPSHKIDMASAQCGSELSGSESFWSNTRPGKVYDSLFNGKLANPIIILEELDKAATNSQYDPMGPLYNLLEPRTARTFNDLSVKEITLDASKILWFSSANNLALIDSPILSRFNIFEVAEPTREQTVVIAKSIYRRIREDHPWGETFEPELNEIVALRLAGMPPRKVRLQIIRACACAIRSNRDFLSPEDLAFPGQPSKRGFGFMSA